MCDEDPVPQMTVTDCMQRIGSRLITFENASPQGKQLLLLHNQINYVEDIIFTRDTVNLGISRREVIQTISDIGQESYYFQSENHLHYPIWEKRLPNLKRGGQVIKAQATATEQS